MTDSQNTSVNLEYDPVPGGTVFVQVATYDPDSKQPDGTYKPMVAMVACKVGIERIYQIQKKRDEGLDRTFKEENRPLGFLLFYPEQFASDLLSHCPKEFEGKKDSEMGWQLCDHGPCDIKREGGRIAIKGKMSRF